MKKIIIIALAALAALVSCTREQDSQEPGKKGTVTFMASIAQTKTHLGEKEGTAWPNYWSAGDVINVNGIDSEPIDAVYDGETKAEFTVGNVAATFKAVYPASVVTGYDNGVASLLLPAAQNYVEGSYDPAAFVMTGSSNNEKITFASKVALFSVTPTGNNTKKIHSISLAALGTDKYLAGEFVTDFNEFSPAQAAVNYVTVTAAQDVPLGKPWMIAIPAGDYTTDGFAIVITDEDGGTMTRTAKPGKAYEAGKMYSTELAYVADALSISAEGITSSTAIICWSTNKAHAYTIKVYSDSACQTLVDSYAVPENASCWGEGTPRFCVSGLTGGVTYYVTVTDENKNVTSAALPVTTAAFTVVEPTTTDATVGQVILAEDFSELRWDSELITGGVGYFPTSMSSFANTEVDEFLPVDTNTERVLGSQTSALSASRLAHWAQGAKNNLYIHPGYIKLVGSKNVTHIVTPALNSIPDGKLATLKVEVTASAYYSESSSSYATLDAAVSVQTGSLNELTDETKTNTLDLSTNTYDIALDEATAWKTYTATLSNVVKGNRIAFGAQEDVAGNSARMNISDIKITIMALDDPAPLVLEATAKNVTSSTAAISWTYGESSSAENDVAYPYTAAIYSNEACTNLVVSHHFDAEASCWGTGEDVKSPCFSFGGLAPSTTYWFVVTNTESNEVSEKISFTTAAFTPVDATTVSNATAGTVLLAEDFSEIGWGPDEFAGGAGFVPSPKNLNAPSGASPEGYFTDSGNTGQRIFGTGVDLGESRLSKGWGFFGNSSTYLRTAYLRVGSKGGRTHMVTPALAGIPAGKLADIQVTVTATKYDSGMQIAAFAEKGLTMNSQTSTSEATYRKYTGASLSDGQAFDITSVKGPWETKTVTLTNVDNECQLLIGSLSDNDGQNRFYFKDIVVTVIDIHEPALVATVKEVSSSTAAIGWTYGESAAADIAKPYTAAIYSNAACTNLVVSHAFEAEAGCWDGKSPRFSFGGLAPSTNYWFVVTDTESNKKSDAVAFTTEAFTVVDATAVNNAAVGDVILAEDFSEIGWGPDEFATAAGFVPSPKNLNAPSGASPAGGFTVYNNTGNRIFGTGVDLGSSRLSKGWGFVGNSALYLRNAYLRITTTSSGARTHLVTPALSGIPAGKIATIEVTVTATKHESNENDVAVFVENNLAMNGESDPGSANYKKYTGASLSDGHALGITAVKDWQTESVTISGVYPYSQLVIGSYENIDTKNRFSITDVKVKITALEDDPVMSIYDNATFQEFVNAVAGGNKTLDANVTASFAVSAATAAAFSSIEDYEGTLNGSGKTISGLSKPLFNDLKGTVKNLTLNSTLNITADQLDLGILANVLSGTAIGCKSQGSVIFNVAGGVTGEHHIAGLIGKANSGAEMTGCTNEASVTNYTSNAGGNESELMVSGVLGTFWGVDFTISDCVNTGAVINNGAWNKDVSVGGIIGQAGNSSDKSCTMTVTSCTNSGAITNNGANADATNSVGGVIGWIRFGTYTDNSNTGTVTNTGNSKQNRVGGLIGYLDKNATFDGNSNSGDVSNTGEVTDINYVGGLLGRMQTGSTFKNNSNSGTVTNTGDATNYVYMGGIVGYLDKNNVIADAGSSAQYKLTNSGNIVNGGSAKNICIGGLFGRNSSGYFNMTGSGSKYSSNSGNITDNSGPAKSNGGDLSIGGIAGYTTTGIKTQYARNSGDIYVTGDKGSTSINVGGIGGWISNASFNFNNCRNTGNVTVDATTTASIWAAGIVACPKPNTTQHYYWRSNATIDTHLATVGGENYTAGLMATVEGNDASSTFQMTGHRLAGTIWGSKTTTGLFCCTKNNTASFIIKKGDEDNPNMIAPGTVRKDNTHDDTINEITDVTIGVLAGGVGSTYDITSVIADEHLVVQDW